jgi:NinB protein.
MKRSTEANRRYWMLLHLMAEKLKPGGQEFSAEVWHTWAKSKFLGCDDVKLPTGKVLSIPRSSADLDTAEFSEFMTQIEVFANERDVWLEDIG